MTSSEAEPAPAATSQPAGRLWARLSIGAAFLSCTLNCVFSQLASRAASPFSPFAWLVDWASLAVVLVGIMLGGVGLASGWRQKSSDTAAIATIGLVLNLGIVFIVVWYFVVVRPQGGE